MKTNQRFLFRLIIPSYPFFNIYTKAGKKTTALGPVIIATCAHKLFNWDVEIIDENNCDSPFCPKTDDNRVDHASLQKQHPADVVGFYGSLSSTIPRLYQIANFYHSQKVLTLAGGKHVENLPDEANQNDIDIVVFREGEETIVEILKAFEDRLSFQNIRGIQYRDNQQFIKTGERPLIHNFEQYPYPDFNLVRYAKIKIFPINRTRGCNSKCEFCEVKDQARSCSAEYLMGQITHLVENHHARSFFECSDHFASNREDTIHFCQLFKEYQMKINKKLSLMVQVRLTDARYPELLKAMHSAGIQTVAIGYESPIDEELLAMKKGYVSKHMLEWTKVYHQFGFFIHGMFMFGYPALHNQALNIPVKEKIKRFKQFIWKAKIDTIQVLLTVPLPGTALRDRLEKENRIFPNDIIGWEYYDGQFPLFQPDNGVSPEKLQFEVDRLIKHYYSFSNFFKVLINILFHFPIMILLPAISIVTFKMKYLNKGFRIWNKKFFRNSTFRFGGHLLFKKWVKQFKNNSFLSKLTQVEALYKKRKMIS